MAAESLDSSELDGRAEERVRFLLEVHYNEVAAFWTRTNVFIVVMGAALAGMLSTSVAGNESVKFLISLIGLIVSAAWWQVNRMSAYYQARWIEAARELVGDVAGLTIYRAPLGLDRAEARARRPSGPGADKMVYLVICSFAGAWFALVACALARLLCGSAS
jgi:hypothetical protein